MGVVRTRVKQSPGPGGSQGWEVSGPVAVRADTWGRCTEGSRSQGQAHTLYTGGIEQPRESRKQESHVKPFSFKKNFSSCVESG